MEPLGNTDTELYSMSYASLTTAGDLARFGQMLLNRGTYGDTVFFGEDVFERMLPRRLSEAYGIPSDREVGLGMQYFRRDGLGDNTIGHGSGSSTTLRVDLDNNLVIAMTRNAPGRNFDEYHNRFIRLITSNLQSEM